MTYVAAKLGAINEYGGRPVEGKGPWTAEELLVIYQQQSDWHFSVELETRHATREAADAEFATYGFPKYVNARVGRVSTADGGFYQITMHISGTDASNHRQPRTSKVTGASNEAGMRRLQKFIACVEAARG